MVPYLNAQVLMRLHRYTMGQSVSYFNNDFAGRISQKQMQASRAAAEVALETINTLIFASATFVAAVLLLISIDWRLSLIAAVWLVGYAAFIRYFIPRVRIRSAARAAARASVTGVIVDTITNMQTVKLFAHRDHEDQAAQGALGRYLEKGVEFGVMSAAFRFLLITLAGTLPVLLVGLCPAAVAERRGHGGGDCGHWHGFAAPVPDDRLGQLHAAGHLRQPWRGRRRDEDFGR